MPSNDPTSFIVSLLAIIHTQSNCCIKSLSQTHTTTYSTTVVYCLMSMWRKCSTRCCKVHRFQHLFRSWKVASFVLGVVFSQSLAHIVAVANLMPYLMDVLEEKLPKAAATVNIRMGITATMSICDSFLSNAYIGRYQMILCSTIIYIIGLFLLTLSASMLPKDTSAYSRSEGVNVFRIALLLIAFGKAGHSPMLKAFGADQLKSSPEEDGHDRVTKRVKFWWCTGVNLGASAGIILLAVVEGKQHWVIGYGVLALTMLITFYLFISGKSFYRYVEPRGSVLTRASRVIVASLLNRHLDFPPNATQFYHGNSNQLLPHTDGLRFLDKAAIMELPSPNLEEQEKKWRLCTLTEVEETKLLLRMFPIWTAFLIYGIVKSLGSTFFLQQGSNMDRELGHGKVPLPLLLIFTRYVSGQISWLDKRLSKMFPGLKQVVTPTRRIGIGMLFCVLCCSIAALVEAKRLDVVKQCGLLDKPKDTLPISVFWLTPQFLLLGAMDGFTYPGIKDFFYDQVPKSMKNFGPSFTASVIGVGSLLNVIVIVASDKASRQGGRTSWFAGTMNRSRLDYFYWTLTILSCINLVFYGFVATKYTYKKTDAEDEPEADIANGMTF